MKYKFEQTERLIVMNKNESRIVNQLAQLLELPSQAVREIVEILESKTPVTLKRCYEKAPEESIQQALAERKWDQAVEIAARKAETKEEFAKIFAMARENSEGYFLALEGAYVRSCAEEHPFACITCASKK